MKYGRLAMPSFDIASACQYMSTSASAKNNLLDMNLLDRDTLEGRLKDGHQTGHSWQFYWPNVSLKRWMTKNEWMSFHYILTLVLLFRCPFKMVKRWIKKCFFFNLFHNNDIIIVRFLTKT
jgi:hypothetical protein